MKKNYNVFDLDILILVLHMDDVYNGFVAGSAQTIIGHPFDTIKTRIQMGMGYKLIGLYRGFFPPLVGGCVQNSFLFGTEKHFERKMPNGFCAGFISGGLSTLLISPAEYIKCNMQKNRNLRVMDVVRGGNMMRGFWLTFMRDSVGFGIYFSLYEYLQRRRDNPLVNGGIAGVGSWLYSYPIDTVKTIQQVEGRDVLGILRGMDMRGLCGGMRWMLGRAFMVNAGIFYIFEKMKKNNSK